MKSVIVIRMLAGWLAITMSEHLKRLQKVPQSEHKTGRIRYEVCDHGHDRQIRMNERAIFYYRIHPRSE